MLIMSLLKLCQILSKNCSTKNLLRKCVNTVVLAVCIIFTMGDLKGGEEFLGLQPPKWSELKYRM